MAYSTNYPYFNVPTFSTLSAFPAAATNGYAALALDTDNLYVYNTGSASWIVIAGPGSVLSIGTIDSQTPSANGAVIASDQLIMQSASATVPGLMNTTTQTVAGNKTFTGTLKPGNILNASSGQLLVDTTNAAFYDTQNPSIKAYDAGNRELFDDLGKLALDFNSGSGGVRCLFDGAQKQSIDWQLRTLRDVSGNITAVWSATGIYTPNLLTSDVGLNILDTSAAHYVKIRATSSTLLTADHQLTIDTTNVDSTLKMEANLTVTAAATISGTNTGDVTLTAVGSAPNANAASLSGQALTLQPADATHPGVVTTAAQTMAGVKTFSSPPNFSSLTASLPLQLDASTNVISSAIDLSGSQATGILAAGRFPALTGDITTTTGALATTLATVNSNTGSFGSSTAIPNFTVNAKGLITAAGTNAVIAPAGTLTGTTLASNVVTSSLTAVGTLISGTWQATTIGTGFGGTGVTSVTTTPTATAFAGWDANTNLSATNFLAGYATTATAAGTTTLTVSSKEYQYFTGTTTQTVTLPNATTLTLGQSYTVVNNSTGTVTVNNNGGTTIQAMASSSSCVFTVINIGSANGTWNAAYILNSSANNGITALTGDATATGPGSVALTLATVNSNTGSFGSSTAIPNFTVNGKGLITAAGTNAVIAPAGTLTGTMLASNVVTSSLTSVGTITSGTWNGTTVAVANGGTGVTSVTTAPTATAWAGWDANKNLSSNNAIEGYTTTATAAGTTTLTVGSTYLQYFTGTTTQTVTLPVVSTLVLGQQFKIYNNSTGTVTVQSSGGNTIQAMAGSTVLEVTVISTSGTGTASWNALYTTTTAGSGTVTSVAMTVPAFLSVSGSPITTSGTLGVTLSGTALPVANGGTGVTSVTTTPTATSFAGWDANKNLSSTGFLAAQATTATAAGTTTLTVSSNQIQYFTGTTTQTVVLPVASTLVNGQQFLVINASTGVVTVQTSANIYIQSLASNTQCLVTCVNTAGGTGTASWSAIYSPYNTGLIPQQFFKAPTVQRFTSTGTQTGWLFTISTSTTCAVGDTYTNNSNTYTVQGALSAQSGQVLYMSGTGATSGTTLTRSAGSGTSSITFSTKVATATYTTPTSPSPLYIKITVVGDGGGGGGGGTGGGPGGAGGNGTGTGFGANIIFCNGGTGGAFDAHGGAGGTVGTFATATTIQNATGGGAGGGINVSFGAGGVGGSSALGGAGFGSNDNVTTGGSGAANTGGGGGGGGAGTSAFGGAGGGAGAYAIGSIVGAAATYPYLVGTGGSGGAAGTTGAAGGAGGSGGITVEEYYQ